MLRVRSYLAKMNPPAFYSDYSENIVLDHSGCATEKNVGYVEHHHGTGAKHRERVPNDKDSTCMNGCNEPRAEFPSNTNNHRKSIKIRSVRG